MSDGLVVQNLVFRYNERQEQPSIAEFNIVLPKGRAVCIAGESGCGKSTLFYLLAGIYPEYSGVVHAGSITYDGADLSQWSKQARARKVSMMFQNPELQFCMDTVENELIFCLENIKVPRDEMDQRIQEALAFCEIEVLRGRMFKTLSGGEKQKVSLACIVAMQSEYILLDEPFANIDPYSAANIIEKLIRLKKEKGSTIILIDHQVDHVLELIDDWLILGTGGQILAYTPNDRHTAKDRQHAAQDRQEAAQEAWLDSLGIKVGSIPYAGWSRGADDNVGVRRAEGVESGTDRIVGEGTGMLSSFRGSGHVDRSLSEDENDDRVVSSPATPILELRGVSAGYEGGRHVLKDVSIPFYAGKINVITGRSGSGKSTLFSLLGKMRAYVGEVKFRGRELAKIKPAAYAKEVGLVFQNPQDQFLCNTVYEEMKLSLRNIHAKEEELAEAIKRHLTELRLWAYRHFSPYMLSQGQQRRLAVGILLAYQCKILICDEPTYGQDRRNIEAMMNMLCAKVKDEGLTVILSTHDNELAEAYGDVHYECTEGTLIPRYGVREDWAVRQYEQKAGYDGIRTGVIEC